MEACLDEVTYRAVLGLMKREIEQEIVLLRMAQAFGRSANETRLQELRGRLAAVTDRRQVSVVADGL